MTAGRTNHTAFAASKQRAIWEIPDAPQAQAPEPRPPWPSCSCCPWPFADYKTLLCSVCSRRQTKGSA